MDKPALRQGAYKVTEEEILRYMKMTGAEKLQALEDVNKAVTYALMTVRRRMWED